MMQPPSYGQPIARSSGAALLSGLSSATKPTNLDAGSIFLETDTGISFTFSGTVWTRMGGGAVLGSAGTPRWVTPGWLINDRSSNTMIVGTLRYTAIFVSKRTTYDRIGVQITAGVASALVRLGLYDCQDDLPNNLLLDAGTIDAAIAGNKEIVIAMTLDRGYYFTAVVGDTAVGIEGMQDARFVSAPIGGWGATVDARHSDHLTVAGVVGDVAAGLQDPARAPDGSGRERVYAQLRIP